MSYERWSTDKQTGRQTKLYCVFTSGIMKLIKLNFLWCVLESGQLVRLDRGSMHAKIYLYLHLCKFCGTLLQKVTLLWLFVAFPIFSLFWNNLIHLTGIWSIVMRHKRSHISHQNVCYSTSTCIVSSNFCAYITSTVRRIYMHGTWQKLVS